MAGAFMTLPTKEQIAKLELNLADSTAPIAIVERKMLLLLISCAKCLHEIAEHCDAEGNDLPVGRIRNQLLEIARRFMGREFARTYKTIFHSSPLTGSRKGRRKRDDLFTS